MATQTKGKRGRPVGPQDGRAKIISSAAKLFRTKGFDGTTVRELAEVAGMQSGSLFYFFPTKEDILIAVIEQRMEQVRSAVTHARKDLSPQEGFRAMLRSHLELLLGESTEQSTLLILAWRGFPDRARRVARELTRQYDGLWEEQIEALMQEGAWRSPGEPYLSRAALFGALNWCRQWYHPELGNITDRMIQVLVDMFIVQAPPADA